MLNTTAFPALLGPLCYRYVTDALPHFLSIFCNFYRTVNGKKHFGNAPVNENILIELIYVEMKSKEIIILSIIFKFSTVLSKPK
jgi:hypothetical protein